MRIVPILSPPVRCKKKITTRDVTQSPASHLTMTPTTSSTTPEKQQTPFSSITPALHPTLISTLDSLSYKNATEMQQKTLEVTLRDHRHCIVGVSDSDTGKSLAFCLSVLDPIFKGKLQRLDDDASAPLPTASVLILEPTRELAEHMHRYLEKILQTAAAIAEEDNADSPAPITSMLLTSQKDLGKQRLQLERNRPTILISTPGRINKLLDLGTFSLENTRYLVLDEADKLLTISYEKEVLRVIQNTRHSRYALHLFGTRYTKKMKQVCQSSLDEKHTTILNLMKEVKHASLNQVNQRFLFVPEKFRHAYLAYILNENPGKRILVFAHDSNTCIQLSIMLRSVGFSAAPIAGLMKEKQKKSCLKKFHKGDTPVLIVTDVALRGLELSQVEMVVNYELPVRPGDYIHRVKRIAQFDPSLEVESLDAVTILSQYDLEYFQKIEAKAQVKMEEYPHNEEHVKLLTDTIDEAWKLAQSKAAPRSRKQKGKKSEDDAEALEEHADDATLALSKKRKRKKDSLGDLNEESKTKKKRVRS